MPRWLQIGIWYVVLIANVGMVLLLAVLDAQGATIPLPSYALTVLLILGALAGLWFCRHTNDMIHGDSDDDT